MEDRSNAPAAKAEGFPADAFSGAPSYVNGLRRSAGGPNYMPNCFVGAFDKAVDYRIDLTTGGGVSIGGPITGLLNPFHMVRHLDVLAIAGTAPNDYVNVRAKFTSTGPQAPAFVGFCTMQESVTFGADFRIAK